MTIKWSTGVAVLFLATRCHAFLWVFMVLFCQHTGSIAQGTCSLPIAYPFRSAFLNTLLQASKMESEDDNCYIS